MNHALTRVLALVTFTLSATFGTTASAQQSEPPAEAPAPTPVEIVLVGGAGKDASLDARIQSWFGPETVLSIGRERVLMAESVLAGRSSRGVTVWVTLRTRNEARLYFAAASEAEEPTRYLLRDVPLNDGLDEIGSERVAQVVHSSVTALIDDSVDVVPRPEIERELTPPLLPPPPTATDTRVDSPPAEPDDHQVEPLSFAALTAAFYRASFAGDEGFPHGPGLALGGALERGAFGVGAIARGQYAWPHSVRVEDVDVTFTELSIRLGGRAAFRSRSLTLDLEAGGGVAWVRYDPEATESGPLPAPRDTDERFFWFASAGIRHALGPVQLGGRLELELYPALSHYTLDTGRELAVSSRMRPALVLELVVD
jgi:hypothetical protein